MCNKYTTEELLEFIVKEIRTFDNLEIIKNGIAFHYTTYAKDILKAKKFYGAPINKDLDKTQMKIKSDPATNDPGVVFAYDNIEDAKEEGFDCDIFKKEYYEAIRTTHSQEATLGAPPTILILNSCIKNFEHIKWEIK